MSSGKDVRKAAIEGTKCVALFAIRPEIRLNALNLLRKTAENQGDADAVNAIRYLASEGSEEVSSSAKKWLRRLDEY